MQSTLVARLLGPSGFGLVAIVTSYATTVNGFLSFRMSELVVRYGGEYLEKDEKEKTVALVEFAALMESTVSLLAFLVVVATATLASRYIAKTPDTATLFIIYSLGLLHETIPFVLPAHRRKVRWESILDTYDPKSIRKKPLYMRGGEVYELNARSLALLRLPRHVEGREDKRQDVLAARIKRRAMEAERTSV